MVALSATFEIWIWPLGIAFWSVNLIGHTAIWLGAFNRINATGLARPTIKRIEKLFVLAWFVLPWILVLPFFTGQLRGLPFLDPGGTTAAMLQHPLAALSIVYLAVGWLVMLWMLPGWLRSRIELSSWQQSRWQIKEVTWDMANALPHPVYASRWTRLLGQLPGNEIGKLQRTWKRIPFHGHPAFHGMRLGHLSDLHLTGSMALPYYQHAIDRLLELEPDILLVTGDLIDYDHQLPQLEQLLPLLKARHGVYFVLGNHDRRLLDPNVIRQLFTACGGVDLGKGSGSILTESGNLLLVGNERPWFGTAPTAWPEPIEPTQPTLRLALAHSPDQWKWGTQLKADLFLAGHTHGGQVRLPGIGPLVAPSWYGSQYASGFFRRGAMGMHVSRGLSGVHPIRYRCLPEVSLLEIAPAPNSLHQTSD